MENAPPTGQPIITNTAMVSPYYYLRGFHFPDLLLIDNRECANEKGDGFLARLAVVGTGMGHDRLVIDGRSSCSTKRDVAA